MDQKVLTYRITYYSGTGGTELIANCLAEKLQLFGPVIIEKVTEGLHKDSRPFDRLILLFPVHAFHAPGAIYKWVKNSPAVNKLSAAVISVSGGGEICPNTASRLSCIKMLEKRGLK